MSDTTESAHPEPEEWLTTYERLGIAEEQLAESRQENERLRASLVEATRATDDAWEIIDAALTGLRDPMTMDDAHRAKAMMTHHVVARKKAAARARHAASLHTDTPHD